MTAQANEQQWRFPAIVVFSDGQEYWLADGFHRVLAAREAGLEEIPAEVRSGGQRDALLFSISANSEHGFPRSNADKRNAVLLLLRDAEWCQWSDHEIARRYGSAKSLLASFARAHLITVIRCALGKCAEAIGSTQWTPFHRGQGQC